MVYSNNKPVSFLIILTLLLTLALPVLSESEGARWNLVVEQSEVATNLSTTQFAVQYGGDLSATDYEAKPDDGNIYLLVKMLIEKEQAGKGKFIWDQLAVVDSEGNEYKRHENDTFLESHNLKRIKATDLSFGKNDGFICFEIPAKVAAGALTLIYTYESGETVEIPLEPTK